ncbi:MAG: cobalamin-binding protein [Thermoprotei archaeon]|nr:MAG: cobalamin-binding protein [Thermoprotei archaeon]
MKHSDILEKLKNYMSTIETLDINVLRKLVEEALENYSPEEVIEKSLRPAMEIIGEKFKEGEYFIAELVLAADIFKEIFNTYLKPRIAERGKAKTLGKVIIGTIEGDIHDIGKSIVSVVFQSSGFEVIDLGVDVPAWKFVEEAEKRKADVIAISALLTTTMLNIEKVIAILKEKGIRDKYIVIVGGAPLSEEFARKIGADAYGKDPYDGLKKLKELLAKRHKQ